MRRLGRVVFWSALIVGCGIDRPRTPGHPEDPTAVSPTDAATVPALPRDSGTTAPVPTDAIAVQDAPPPTADRPDAADGHPFPRPDAASDTLDAGSNASPDTGSPPAGSPPSITRLQARWNPARSALGLVVEGLDPDADVDSVELDVDSAEGIRSWHLMVGETPESFVALTATERGYRFDVGVSVPDRVPTRVRVSVTDVRGLVSEIVETADLPAPDSAGEGDACDAFGALRVCAEPSVCTDGVCRRPPGCRGAGPLIDVARLPEGEGWHYQGHIRASEDDRWPCRSAWWAVGPLVFTAPVAGTYAFRVQASESEVFFGARSGCAGVAPELFCAQVGPVAPTLVLAEGEQVFLGIDGDESDIDLVVRPADPPVVSSAAAYWSAFPLGLEVTGRLGEAPVTSVAIQIPGPGGGTYPLRGPAGWYESQDRDGEPATFHLRAAAQRDPNLFSPAENLRGRRVALFAVDALGNRSAPVEAVVDWGPGELRLGELCSEDNVFGFCGVGAVCRVDQEVLDRSVCATAAGIQRLDFSVVADADHGRYRVTIRGSDETRSASAVHFAVGSGGNLAWAEHRDGSPGRYRFADFGRLSWHGDVFEGSQQYGPSDFPPARYSTVLPDAAQVAIESERGYASTWDLESLTAPPSLDVGAPCTLETLDGLCRIGTVCELDEGRCVEGVPPLVTAAHVYSNRARTAVGIEMEVDLPADSAVGFDMRAVQADVFWAIGDGLDSEPSGRWYAWDSIERIGESHYVLRRTFREGIWPGFSLDQMPPVHLRVRTSRPHRAPDEVVVAASEPAVMPPGGRCIPGRLFSECSAGEFCDSAMAGGTCRPGTAPEIESVAAFLSVDGLELGLEVVGRDEGDDFRGGLLELEGPDGFTQSDLGVEPLPETLWVWFSPFDLVSDLGGHRFRARYIVHQPTMWAREIGSVRFTPVDGEGMLGPMVEVPVTEAPRLATGAPCDPTLAFGRCPEGELCPHGGDTPACEAHETACPDAVGEVRIAPESGVRGRWTVDGVTAPLPIDTSVSCANGAAAKVYAFTAPQAGRFAFELVDGDWVWWGDAVALFSHCDAPAADRELACRSVMDPENAPPISVHLDAGETVRAVVVHEVERADGVGRPFRLTVSVLPPIGAPVP